MARDDGSADDGVRTKAVLVDPSSMTVRWTNASASRTMTGRPDAPPASIAFELVTLLAGAQDLRDTVLEVAASGTPRTCAASLVSTGRGGLDLLTTAYRLPDGSVLLITENALQTREKAVAPPRRPARGR